MKQPAVSLNTQTSSLGRDSMKGEELKRFNKENIIYLLLYYKEWIDNKKIFGTVGKDASRLLHGSGTRLSLRMRIVIRDAKKKMTGNLTVILLVN